MRVHQHQVRYHEVDAQGFMFNARYLEIVDVAMAEYFRALGWTYAELGACGADPSVVSANLSFSKPARHDDILVVTVACLRVGISSFSLSFEFSRAEESVAVAELVYVNVDPAVAAARPLPPPVADALRAHVPSRGRS